MPTGEAGRGARVRSASNDGAPPPQDPAIVRQQADDAQELLASPAFVRALEMLAGEAQDKFENSAPGSTGSADRDSAHATLRALGGIHERLMAMVDDAKFSAAQEADESDDGE